MARLIVKKEDILHNYRLLRERCVSPVIPVLKANGYGLGAEGLFSLLQSEGATRFAFSRPEEALPFLGRGAELLVLSCGRSESYARFVLETGITAAVDDLSFAQTLSALAAEQNKTVSVHLKVDTGMGRFGFLPEQIEEMAAVCALPGVQVTGIFSHCHSAFSDDGSAERQLKIFTDTCAALAQRGVGPLLRHIANSSAALKSDAFALDGVRIGSALTGRVPCQTDLPLKRVGVLEGEILAVRTLPAGANLGYGGVCNMKKETTVAIVSVGTADGFLRETAQALTRPRDLLRDLFHDLRRFVRKPAFYATVNDQPVRLLGRPATAHSFFDVTNVPCVPGDRVFFDTPPLRVDGTVERIYE